MKKGLDRYFDRCNKKGVKIISEPKMIDGHKTFTVKDPFGIVLVITEVPDKKAHTANNFAGMPLSERDIIQKTRKEADVLDDMVSHLRKFGVLRRAGKKYAKSWIKKVTKKTKS